jgi:hypothetical protein
MLPQPKKFTTAKEVYHNQRRSLNIDKGENICYIKVSIFIMDTN